MTMFGRRSGAEGPEIRIPSVSHWRSWSIWKFLGVLVLLILLWSSVTRIDTGHVGVLTLFGRVTGDVLPEGIHLINPLKKVNELTIRTQNLKETASVPSTEGLIMTLDTSLLFRLDPTKAAEVFRTIGPRYVEVVVEPNLRSAIRAITASHYMARLRCFFLS